jgi:predicted DNA binding CopG/RHH family protein
MPRQARLDAPGALHHIMIRGIERRKIFVNDRDREDFVERLSKLLQQTETACYAWVFIPNHAQQEGNQGLSKRTGDMSVQYDKEEKELLEAYESGVMKLSTPSKKEIDAIKAAAQNTFKKDGRITIRLFDHDFKGIKKKALQTCIPYQTLISGIIHRYVEGELVSKKDNQANSAGSKRKKGVSPS